MSNNDEHLAAGARFWSVVKTALSFGMPYLCVHTCVCVSVYTRYERNMVRDAGKRERETVVGGIRIRQRWWEGSRWRWDKERERENEKELRDDTVEREGGRELKVGRLRVKRHEERRGERRGHGRERKANALVGAVTGSTGTQRRGAIFFFFSSGYAISYAMNISAGPIQAHPHKKIIPSGLAPSHL